MNKALEYFKDMSVKKSSARDLFATLSVPSFIRDWFLKRYSDQDGELNAEFARAKIKDILPRKDSWNSILDRLLYGERVKFVAKISVRLDIRTGNVSFELPDFGVSDSETMIPFDVWDEHKDDLMCGDGEIWGILTLERALIMPPGKNKQPVGKLSLVDFRSFVPYKVDLAYYKSCRDRFMLDEWIDFLLMAMDYNPAGFKTEEEKLTMLTRLLPFVEKRLNLIELAPKGTGKSYVFSQLSKHGWLVSGGVMTRAKMFYDMKNKTDGLVAYYDYVALDEVATIKFPDVAEMQGALKGYLESGTYNVGVKAGKADAGIIMLGNIASEKMNTNINMFTTLPPIFSDSALIDRFHGFIQGWKIPRMSENLKAEGWALNAEYFSEILHLLRDDITINGVVDALIKVPTDADTRDTTAIKRMASAFVKILFPSWDQPDKTDSELFERYCLKPAVMMRGIIRKQLAIMDPEYGGKSIADYAVKQMA